MTKENYTIMKKKLYQQPQTESLAFQTGMMMQELHVSTGEGGGGGGTGHMPRRGEIIP